MDLVLVLQIILAVTVLAVILVLLDGDGTRKRYEKRRAEMAARLTGRPSG